MEGHLGLRVPHDYDFEPDGPKESGDSRRMNPSYPLFTWGDFDACFSRFNSWACKIPPCYETEFLSREVLDIFQAFFFRHGLEYIDITSRSYRVPGGGARNTGASRAFSAASLGGRVGSQFFPT